MKKLIPAALSFVTAVALAMGSSFVFAQDTSSTASSITSKDSENSKNFQDRKTKVLQHINDRITKMQQIQSCVQAALDLEALRACKPHNDKDQVNKAH